MAQTPAPEPLAPDVAARLAEFARACKAATRIVSLYPPSHPSIQSALARMSDAGRHAVANGPFAITVLPDALLIEGRGLSKPEAAATELAMLMHQQLIGELTLTGVLDNGAWHTFLSLLAKTPEDIRAAGGITRAWHSAGGGPIDLKEIDYAEVLRERTGVTGESVTWDQIIAGSLEGGAGIDQGVLAVMLDIVNDPERLATFAARFQDRGKASGEDSATQRKSLVQVMHGLANYAAAQAPQNLNSVLDHMAAAAAHLSPDMMIALMTDPPPLAHDPNAPRLDLAGELQSRLTDEQLSQFVADNVVKDRGATTRLAAAFHTLVPDADRQQQVIAMAMQMAAGSSLGQDPQFENVWSSSVEMLTSYSDAQFVSDDYARELTTARTQAMEVERVADDPPGRISAWISTVSDEDIRALDQRLILDLLKIEQRPDAWASVLDVAVTRIEQLVLVGDLRLASELLEAVFGTAHEESSPFAAAASAGLNRLASGPLVKHLVLFMRQATDTELMLVNQICQTVGPVLVGPLADALAAEDNARTVRRLRDVLIGFGSKARAHANELRGSANPAVRRAAIDLLRALGGDGALPDLRSLLEDAEPQVQREALRAIVQIGTNEAYETLETALKTGAPRTRDAIMQALGFLRDERAAPLFVYIIEHSGYTGSLEGVYISLIEALGKVGGDPESVRVLTSILHRREWWAPLRTGRIRTAAAKALRASGSQAAERALAEAGGGGSAGVKRVAKAALAEPVPPKTSIRRTS